MKKMFGVLGIIVSLFTIFFFLLCADTMLYIDEEDMYDFEIEQGGINVGRLEKLANESNVTIRLSDYRNVSFGQCDIRISLINVRDHFLGRQDSIFPGQKIIYKKYNGNKRMRINRFGISCPVKNKETFETNLKKAGYEYSAEEFEKSYLSFGTLFSSLNLMFFVCLGILLILLISAYYISRLKEIGVYKLNGFSSGFISFSLLKGAAINLFLTCLLTDGCFLIYIVLNQVVLVPVFIKLAGWMLLFCLLILLPAGFIAGLFISRINQTAAIKKQRNSRLLTDLLLIIKIPILVLLTVSISVSFSNILFNFDIVKDTGSLRKLNLFCVNTATSDRSVIKKADSIIKKLDSDQVYNYAPSENLFNAQNSVKEYRDENGAVSIVSENCLPLLDIKDAGGNALNGDILKGAGEKYLVPMRLRRYKKYLLNEIGIEKNSSVIYIKNDQKIKTITDPGSYEYNCIFLVKKAQKKLYPSYSSQLLLTKSAAEDAASGLEKSNIDTNSVSIRSEKSDYDILRNNTKIEFYEHGFRLIINLLSYLFCVIAIIRMFMESRQKEIGVYRLNGVFPWKTILCFLFVNLLISAVIISIVSAKFMLVILIEGVIIFAAVRKFRELPAPQMLKE